MDNISIDKFCSFCMKSGADGTKLSGGHGAWICEQCAHRVAETFETRKDAGEPLWASMSDSEALETLPDIVATGEQHDEFLHDWVDMLREQGISWHQIGLTLGVSRQAVWQRFTRRHTTTTS